MTSPSGEALLRLVYVSISDAVIERSALERILARSQTHNVLAGITGVLCAGRRHYLQVLEGPQRGVMELYLRIAADPRHREVALLSIELVAERMFAEWSMGQVHVADVTSDVHVQLLAQRRLQVSRQHVADLLQRFVRTLREKAPTR